MPQQAKTLLMGGALGVLIGFLVAQWQPQSALSHRDKLPRAAIQVVYRATALINDMNHETFGMFDRDAFYARGDAYLFVLAADGTTLYHARDRSQIGTDFTRLTDEDGRAFGQTMINDTSPDGVWSAYRWHNSATGRSEWKLTFTRQTQQGHIVGAGIFAGHNQRGD